MEEGLIEGQIAQTGPTLEHAYSNNHDAVDKLRVATSHAKPAVTEAEATEAVAAAAAS